MDYDFSLDIVNFAEYCIDMEEIIIENFEKFNIFPISFKILYKDKSIIK